MICYVAGGSEKASSQVGENDAPRRGKGVSQTNPFLYNNRGFPLLNLSSSERKLKIRYIGLSFRFK